ncbi:hypothetical protein Tco_0257601 [Tanacetum coccineum]
MFMDEIVKVRIRMLLIVVTPSKLRTFESNHESADVKNNGDAVEPKTVRKNSFRPSVIEDWNFDDDRVKDTTARDTTIVSENKEKGVNVVKASACEATPSKKEYKEKEGLNDNGLLST